MLVIPLVLVGCQIQIYSLQWPQPSWIFEIVNFYLLSVSGGPRRITVPNFVKIGRSIAEISPFFEFSRWPPLSWLFEITKFYWIFGSRGSRRISVSNLLKISQSVAKILRFFDFSRWWLSTILYSFGAYVDHTVSSWGSLSLCKI